MSEKKVNVNNSNSDYLKLIFPGYSFYNKAADYMKSHLNNITSENELKNEILVLKGLIKKLNTVNINEDQVVKILKQVQEINGLKKIQKNDILNKKEKTFKNLIDNNDEIQSLLSISNKNLVRYEFIHNYGIIYVDSFNDVPNPKDVIKKHLTNNSEFSFTESVEINNEIFILSDPSYKPKMYLNHLQIIRYYVYQNKNFKSPLNNTKNAVPVYTLGSLIGNKEVISILGVILLSEDGRLMIQDETHKIIVDCSQAKWAKAYFPSGCVVISEGKIINDIFHAYQIIQPPFIQKNMTFSDKVEHDLFGALNKIMKSVDELHSNENTKIPKKKFTSLTNFLELGSFQSKINSYMFPISLESILRKNFENLVMNSNKVKINDDIFNNCKKILNEGYSDVLLISNAILSNKTVMNDLAFLFDKLNVSPPCMIIMMGNFLSDTAFSSFKRQESDFDNLATLIERNSNLNNNCLFAFVSGNEDIQISSNFPIPSLPDYLISILEKKIKHVIPCCNPARFSIFGKEVILFRDELHKKLSRNTLGVENKNLSTQFYMNTLFSQCNLAPLEQEKSPRVWNLAHSLLYFPPPDYLIIADLTEDFVYTENPDTTFINPGNFSRDSSFIIFNPISGIVQPCKVNQNN